MPGIAETAEFIGREPELAQLIELLKDATAGKGQVAFVFGEAGIGKTRIIDELRAKPAGQKFSWLSAKCFYNEGTDPYLPFKDALRAWFGQPAALETEGKIEHKPGDVALEDLTKVPVIGKKLAEDPTAPFGAFMIKEPKTESSLEAFSELVTGGRTGLCITRIPPDKLGTFSKHENSIVYWLSKKPGEFCIPPSLTKLSHEILTFIKTNQNGVVILDGLEYVIGNNDFNKVIRFVNELVDSMAVHRGILIIPIDPLTVDKKQLALMERDMTTIDLTTAEEQLERRIREEAEAAAPVEFNEDVFRQGRDRMFETITQQIINIASTKPVALFIDDLHWADVGALHLLHYLSRAIEHYPVMILGSFRPEELADTDKPHPSQEMLNRMIHEKIVNMISLDRFRKEESDDMIRSLLHDSKFPENLAKLVYDETEGNPFFIEEVLRSMEENEYISFNKSKNTWLLTREIPDIAVPESIKDVVKERTDRLDRTAKIVLECASVLGVEYDYDILAVVVDIKEDELVRYLDDLIRMQLLKELPCGLGEPVCYRFSHSKICEVLYEGLGSSRKRLLHKKSAKAFWEKYENDLESVVFELAQHYFNGGDYRNGLLYMMRAGEKAITNYAPWKARDFYNKAYEALELMEPSPAEAVSINAQRMDILAKLAELNTHIGEWDEALKYSDELIKISSGLDDRWRMAEAHLYAGRIHLYRSAWDEAKQNFQKALDFADESKSTKGSMEAYYGMGNVHERLGEYAQAMEYYQQFMGLALPTNSLSDVAKGYKSFALISSNRGEYNVALEYYKKCIELLSRTDNLTELAKAYTSIGVTYFELGQFDKVIECNQKCIELSSKSGDVRIKGYGYSNASEAYAKLQDLNKALEYANNALEIFTKLDEKSMIGLVWMNFGIIHKYEKNWDLSREYFKKSMAILKEQNVPYFLADCTRQLGLMLIERGTEESLKESKRLLEDSLKIYKDLGANKYVNVIRSELEKLDL